MVRYSRRTLGFVRDLLNAQSDNFTGDPSKLVEYWRNKLFDIGVHSSVVSAMASHSFDWTGIIPAIADGKFGANSYFGFPLSPQDQAEALDLIAELLLQSTPDLTAWNRLRELLSADGFDVKRFEVWKPTPQELDVSPEPASFVAHSGDAEFCRLAVVEARKSIREDDGKPMVGAVVAKDGNLLATAYRGEYPRNHAEYIALEVKLREAILSGSSVYTTLEPCSKRNLPKIPCAERLVQRKVGRVFIGMLDPNPDIQGHGVRVLRDANIEVQFFPHELMMEIEELNRAFTRRFRNAPPIASTFSSTGALSPDQQKISDILKFKGKSITVLNKQKYGHGYLEGTFDAVVIDCDSLGVVLKTSGGELSFSLSQIETSRDLERKTLKLTVYR